MSTPEDYLGPSEKEGLIQDIADVYSNFSQNVSPVVYEGLDSPVYTLTGQYDLEPFDTYEIVKLEYFTQGGKDIRQITVGNDTFEVNDYGFFKVRRNFLVFRDEFQIMLIRAYIAGTTWRKSAQPYHTKKQKNN